MSNNFFKILLILLLITCDIAFTSAQNVPARSQLATTNQIVGITNISIIYSRPHVNNRKIWGGLVPYGYKSYSMISRKSDAPWRTGANAITKISFEHDVTINKKKLKAGTYGITMAIFENGEVDIMFNKNTQSWGVFGYDPENDVLKIKVRSEKVNTLKEEMVFEFFNTTSNSAEIALIWEYKKIPFTVEIETNKIVYQNLLDSQYTSNALLNFASWNSAAAMFLMNNNIGLDKAISWMTAVIGTDKNPNTPNRNFPNLSTQANLHLMVGKDSEATKLLDEAFAIPVQNIGIGTLFFYANQVMNVGEGFPDVAIRTYKFIEDNFPKRKWSTKNGLSYIYTIKGDYKTALKYLKEAKKYAPKNFNEEAYNKKLKELVNKKSSN